MSEDQVRQIIREELKEATNGKGYIADKKWIEEKFRSSDAKFTLLFAKMETMILAIEGLKVKAGVWGAVAAAIPMLLTLIIWMVFKN